MECQRFCWPHTVSQIQQEIFHREKFKKKRNCLCPPKIDISTWTVSMNAHFVCTCETNTLAIPYKWKKMNAFFLFSNFNKNSIRLTICHISVFYNCNGFLRFLNICHTLLLNQFWAVVKLSFSCCCCFFFFFFQLAR